MEDLSDQVVQVIREAIRLEIDGRRFFNHAAEVTQNELGKKMFKKLAQDEMEHLNTFRELFSSIIGAEDWKKFVEEEGPAGQSRVIEELTLKAEEEDKKGELGAIRVGMELERKAIDFFEKSAKGTSDPASKETFTRICEEEKTHYDLLQAQYDSVTNSGYWFDVAEFRMDGKY